MLKGARGAAHNEGEDSSRKDSRVASRRVSYWQDFADDTGEKKGNPYKLDRRISAQRISARRATAERRGSKIKARIAQAFGKSKASGKNPSDEELAMLQAGWEKRNTLEGHQFYLEVDTGRVQWDKPDILKSEAEMAEEKIEWVWVPHPVNVWQPARVKSRERTGTSVRTMDNHSITIPHIGIMKGKLTGGVTQKVPLWSLNRRALDHIEDDLVALPSLDEGMVLHNLRIRYENSEIYTWVGSSHSVLISVNPFQDLGLYKKDVIKEQRLGHDGAEKIGKSLPPHVFGIANDSLEALLYENKSQAILVSGESGAGKTHATKQCLDFLATVASSKKQGSRESRRFEMMAVASGMGGGASDDKVEQKVLVANPVLEAFGNAKTVRNNNSSRFGKWIAVYFDRRSKQINGAQITSFLLESSRVTLQASGERNYHIFYQLLRDEDICERYNLVHNGADNYRYTNQSGCVDIKEVDDEEEFAGVISALEKLGFEDEEQEWLVRTVAAVLHLGNVAFSQTVQSNGSKGVRLLQEGDVPCPEPGSIEAADASKSSRKPKGGLLGAVSASIGRATAGSVASEPNEMANTQDGADAMDADIGDKDMEKESAEEGPADGRKSKVQKGKARKGRQSGERRGRSGTHEQDDSVEGSKNESATGIASADEGPESASASTARSLAREALERCAELLEIESAELEKVLTQRTITVRKETNKIPLTPLAAIKARDSLAKALYARTFDWLVQRVNSAFGDAEGRFIGILDIFGFEIFEHNSFEQLCINYANERLQQLFNQHTFGDEKDLYELEKIQFTEVKFQDNQPVLDLIDSKPNGILNLLDDECVVPGGSDKRLMGRIEGIHDKHNFFKSAGGGKPGGNTNVARAEGDKLAFSISHFAGSVTYDMTGFLAKNADTLFQDLYDVCAKSTDDLTSELFPPMEDNERVKVVSQSAKFREQLGSLMKVLGKTDARYIRCIKPNDKQAPNLFEGRKCLEQLRASGVFEAVAIRKTGFPFRLMHSEFARRYRCINIGYNYRNAITDDDGNGEILRALCLEIIEASPQRFAGVRIGELRVLYRVEDHRMLELLRSLALSAKVPKVQAVWRAALARRFAASLKQAEAALRKAMDVEEPSVPELESAIDDVPDILDTLGKVYRINPPSLAAAKRLHNGLEQWESVEEDLEQYEDCKSAKELPKGVLVEADRLREEGFPMTEAQKELYDHIKQLLLDASSNSSSKKNKTPTEETGRKASVVKTKEAIAALEQKVEEVLQEPTISRNKVESVVKEAKEFTKSSPLLDKAQAVASMFRELDDDAIRAVTMVDRPLLEQVDKKALDCDYNERIMNDVRALLALDERSFVLKEIRSARQWSDKKRQKHRELRLREIDLANCFVDYSDFWGFEQVRPGEASGVGQKTCSTALLGMVGIKKPISAFMPNPSGMDRHSQSLSQYAERATAASVASTASTLKEGADEDGSDPQAREGAQEERKQMGRRHTTRIETSVLNTLRSKEDIKYALKIFENIKCFMGDGRRGLRGPPSPAARNVAGLMVLRAGLENENMRNEIFAQIIMQLTDNPSESSIKAGIDLLCLATAAFPPYEEPFENHFAVWAKLHLPSGFYKALMSTLHHHRLNRNAMTMQLRLLNLLYLDSSAFEGESSEDPDAPEPTVVDPSEDADGALSDNFEQMRAQHSLEALRNRFKAFENGSRHSVRLDWEKDPWMSNPKFESMRSPILESFAVKDLVGQSDAAKKRETGDPITDARVAGTEHRLQTAFERFGAIGMSLRLTGSAIKESSNSWNKPRERPVTRSNSVVALEPSRKELVKAKIDNVGRSLRNTLRRKMKSKSSDEETKAE